MKKPDFRLKGARQMATINTNLVCDLQTAVKVKYIDGNVFSQDAQANTINVTVLDGGEPATISGTVTANIIRADGGTVTATGGTITDNVASITLPAAAYAVPGVVSIVVKLTADDVITTIAAVVATVYQSSTDAAVDPGTIIPSIQTLITEIETAVASIPADYSSLWTSLAPAFNPSKSGGYKVGEYVTNDGGLYRFTSAHSGSWSSGDVVAVNLGGEVYDLKSAFDGTVGLEYHMPASSTQGSSYVISSSNKWASNIHQSAEAIVMAIPNGYTDAVITSTNGSIIAFLKSYSTPVSGQTPDFSAYQTGRISISVGTTEMQVPSDAKYIYSTRKNNSGGDISCEITLYSQHFDERLDMLESDAVIDLSEATINSYIIDTGNKWNTSAGSGTGGVIRIPDGVKKLEIAAIRGSVVAILKNVDNRSTAGATPAFSDNNPKRVKYTRAGHDAFEIGDDDHYLYFNVTSSDGTDTEITSAVCSADVLRVSDRTILEQEIEYTITTILPTLGEGWFDWTLYKSYKDNGDTVYGESTVAKGFATTAPIAVTEGNQVLNLSSAADGDNVAFALYVIEFTSDVFVRRIKVESGDLYIVPEDIDSIRLMYGHASASGIKITKPMLSENFHVKMLTAAKQDAMEKPIYVAYGASTTIGAVHTFSNRRTYFSAFSYPDYIARALNVESYNHGHGTTGFLARSDGTVPNIMDCIFADDELLKKASLVTIMFGYGNDRSAGLPIGLYTDFYPYDEEGYHPGGDEGITTMLAKGATLMGCLNWCIKWISENYPTVTLVICYGSPSMNGDRTITKTANPDSTGSNGIPPYTLTFTDPYQDPGTGGPYDLPTSKQGAAQIRTELPKLQKALAIPIINMMEEGNNINYWNAYATDADGAYAIFSTTGTADDPETWEWNSHPNDVGYKMYARHLAGRIGEIFTH